VAQKNITGRKPICDWSRCRRTVAVENFNSAGREL
jgi:hypothetical protein